MKIIRTVARITPFNIRITFIIIKPYWRENDFVKQYGLANKTKTTIVIDKSVKTIFGLDKCYTRSFSCWFFWIV